MPTTPSATSARSATRCRRCARCSPQPVPFDGEIAPHIPVTIAWAARDLVLPPWQADVAKRMLPQAVHRMMRGVGHVPMWDDPKHVARVLLQGSAPVAEVAPLAALAPRRRRAALATA